MLAFLLTVSILIAGYFHKTDKTIISLFAIWQMITLLLFNQNIIDFGYCYFISAFGNWIILLIISQRATLTSTNLAIQTIVYFLIYADGVGLLLLSAEIEPMLFTNVFSFVFAFALLVVLRGEKNLNDYRIYNRMRARSYRIRGNDYHRSLQQKNHKS
jgi:hypothetical protein